VLSLCFTPIPLISHSFHFSFFVAVFDEGRLSDSHGRVADFRNTVIIMTSNLGQQELRELRMSNNREEINNKLIMENQINSSSSGNSGPRSGPRSGNSESVALRVGEEEVDEALAFRDASYEKLKTEIMGDNEKSNQNQSEISTKKNEFNDVNEEIIHDRTLELVNKYFSLEFVNRIDEVIMFNPLNLESVHSICRVQISKVKALLTARGVCMCLCVCVCVYVHT
jgi:ATP-dependent Clp protease ATP-binding subunit ClpA